MSSGIGVIVGPALKIPVAREICLAILWYVGINYCIQTENWLLMAQLIAAGLAAWALPRGSDYRGWLVGACAIAFAIGGAVAVYHAGVEYGWFAGPTSCSGSGPVATTIEELRRQLLIFRHRHVCLGLSGGARCGRRWRGR